MLKIQRANVVLSIEDDELGRYMSMGYNLIDDKGHILKEAIPNDLGLLQKAYLENNEKIKKLEAELADVKAKLLAKKAKKAEE